MFEDDEHIESFLTLSYEFENIAIDEEQEGVKIEDVPSKEPQDERNLLTHIADK